MPPRPTGRVPVVILPAFIFVIKEPLPLIVPDIWAFPETTSLSVIPVLVPIPIFPLSVILILSVPFVLKDKIPVPDTDNFKSWFVLVPYISLNLIPIPCVSLGCLNIAQVLAPSLA